MCATRKQWFKYLKLLVELLTEQVQFSLVQLHKIYTTPNTNIISSITMYMYTHFHVI